MNYDLFGCPIEEKAPPPKEPLPQSKPVPTAQPAESVMVPVRRYSVLKESATLTTIWHDD